MADLFRSGGGLAALAPEDFEEEEIWALAKSTQSFSKPRKCVSGPAFSSPAWRIAPIPRPASYGGGRRRQELSGSPRPPTPPRRPTAPIDIPDWCKILKQPPKANLWWDDVDAWKDDDAHHDHDHDDDDEDEEENEDEDGDHDHDDDDDEMLPPHEIIARRIARTQVCFSMCEGIGRTLKGRDLSTLRNAILYKTGFLE
ncbi:hypothetical protein DH2020_041774 [Rehmannia glutinosa]|uniref:Senescence regulator n=1 Tax=Rehmannia glutinosa TaxID=99300 RepID=A0ABR0UP78_REHGL